MGELTILTIVVSVGFYAFHMVRKLRERETENPRRSGGRFEARRIIKQPIPPDLRCCDVNELILGTLGRMGYRVGNPIWFSDGTIEFDFNRTLLVSMRVNTSYATSDGPSDSGGRLLTIVMRRISPLGRFYRFTFLSIFILLMYIMEVTNLQHGSAGAEMMFWGLLILTVGLLLFVHAPLALIFRFLIARALRNFPESMLDSISEGLALDVRLCAERRDVSQGRSASSSS